MHTATVSLKSMSYYSQSKAHGAPKLDKESADAYAARTWAEQLHTNDAGEIVIPAMSIKNGLSTVARRLGIKIPGKRNATYTKHFEGGVMVFADISTGLKKADIEFEKRHQPSDGVRGGGKRVWKYHPLIRNWEATFQITVLDDTITERVLREHLEEFGKFVGIGRFRPEKNGHYGRFEVVKMTWQ